MKPLTFCLALASLCFGQAHTGGVIDANLTNASNLPAQALAPNDLIGISVYDAPELTRTVRIDADGTITLPLLKQPIAVNGLMPRQLENAIATALVDDEILNQPLVKVTVVEYYSRPISIVGAVRKPVTFQAIGTVTLLEAIARAEGLTEFAGREIVVSFPNGRDPVRRIPVKALIAAADPEANLKLPGGEEIRVPEAGKVFVVGNVKKPGAFPVRDTEDFSVLKVIAMAEGLAPYSAKAAFIYRKEAPGAPPVEVTVELQKIMKRQAPDVAIQQDDVLYIPDNNGRRLGIAALEKMILFGSTAGATALIWR